MKVLILNFASDVGNSAIAHQVLQHKLNCKVLSVTNRLKRIPHGLICFTDDFFNQLTYESVCCENLVIDVNAFSLVTFISKLQEYKGIEDEIDFFVIPVSGCLNRENGTIKTIEFLKNDLNINLNRIKIIFIKTKNTDDISKYSYVSKYLDENYFPIENIFTIPSNIFFDESAKYLEYYDVLLKNIPDDLIDTLIKDKMILSIDYLSENLPNFLSKKDYFFAKYKLTQNECIRELAYSYSKLAQLSRNAKALKPHIDNLFNAFKMAEIQV